MMWAIEWVFEKLFILGLIAPTVLKQFEIWLFDLVAAWFIGMADCKPAPKDLRLNI